MALMVIAAVFLQVLALGQAKSADLMDARVLALEQQLAMLMENYCGKEMFEQQQKQLELLQDRIENLEKGNEPDDYETAVEMSTQEKKNSGSPTLSSDRATVAFTALKEKDQGSIGVHQKIQFEKVILNIGLAYHARHGLFIVPVSGIYMFSVTLAQLYPSIAAIVHLDGVIAKSYTGAHYTSGSMTVVIYVRAHDHVWVENIDNNGRTVYGNLYSSFTGILLV